MRPSMSATAILHTPIHRHVARLLAAGMILVALAGTPARADDVPLATQLQQGLAGTEPLEIGGVALDRARLALAYDRRSFAPVWEARAQMAAALFAAIGDAGREGLDPEDFGLSSLQAALGGDGMRTARSGASLIQLQRDMFGAHGFERIDRPGTFHLDPDV